MTSRSKKLLQLEEKRNNLEEIRNAREGKVSRLDQLGDESEDDVYDMVDEEEYQKIVENRRNTGDFVVDDDGAGYADDGEEHLGVGEDSYDVKKRLLQAAEDGDSKNAKKAKKLAEAGGQKNTMMNFVRPGGPGASAGRPIVPRVAMTTSLLDIDKLVDGVGQSSSALRSTTRVLPSAMRARPQIRPSHINYSSNSSNSSNPNASGDMGSSGEADHYEYDGNQGCTDYSDYDTAMTTSTAAGIGSPSASSPSATVQPDASVIEPEQPAAAKISLTKTTKKFSQAATPVCSSVDDNKFKNLIGHSSFSSSTSIGDGGASVAELIDLGAGVVGGSGAAAIDPKMWLRKSSVPNEAGEQVESEHVCMFWTDASESNGVIYLFGKVPLVDSTASVPAASGNTSELKYASCCVAIHGCERNLFVLPRAAQGFREDGSRVRAGMGDVHEELTKILVPAVIPRSAGQGFRCKKVRRKYAFEHGDVPREETDYLKVVYSARNGVPSTVQCAQGGKHIERIFGAGSSCLELFVMKRKMMGPCWLLIKNPRTVKDAVSWCKLEVGIENPKFVTLMPQSEAKVFGVPALTTMTISLKTVVNPTSHVHEIVAISGLVHSRVDMEADTECNPRLMRRFTFVRQLGVSCGNNYPALFPHDLVNEAKKTGFIQTFPNERALLSMFFVQVFKEDPDMFASHNLFGFEFDVILSRAVTNKIAMWSQLGRLRRSRPPKNMADKDGAAPGRLLCDTYKAAKEFLRETSYSLSSLAKSQLNFERMEIDPMDVPRFFSNSQDILKLAHHTTNDAFLVQRLMLKLQVVPLTKQLTNLSGNLWSRTMRGARAERIEYLLLHEFHALKFILPEKKAFDNKKVNKAADDDDDDGPGGGGGGGAVGGHSRTRAKAAYAGGLVLEPKKGLYDSYILLLDFNSLYPSIIQEYNLCFTTIEWTKFMPDETAATAANSKDGKASNNNNKDKSKKTTANTIEEEEHGNESEGDEDAGDAAVGDALTTSNKALPPIPDGNMQQGILPRVIKTLVDRRREVKNLLKKEKDSARRQQYDIKQKALKLTANSMYGCLGFVFSRFYARPIAALVTSKGREALQRTVDQATNQMGLEVIYGDTDSVMINTNSTDLAHVKELGNLVKKEVNKLYKSLELDIDGIFKSMLLLKKKKYAAVVIKEGEGGVVHYEKELKGLDLVRRDWCPLSKDTGKFVVDQILSGNPREEIVLAIHTYLRDLAIRVRGGQLDMGCFVVTKGLNKNPKDYPDCKGQAHLQVALQMLKDNKPVNIGDHIPYVICVQGAEGSQAPQRAHHPDEVDRSNGALTIDFEWYLSNQILPPISRLCEPIEGTSPAIMSAQLGLDATKFAKLSAGDGDLLDENWGFTPRSRMDDAERFKDCEKLSCVCTSCGKESQFQGVLMDPTGNSAGLSCTLCGAMYFGRRNAGDCYCYISNRVTKLVRQCLQKYYECWLQCDDHSCGERTMQQSVRGQCTGNCRGRMLRQYDDAALHTQLKFLEALFDLPRIVSRSQAAALASGTPLPASNYISKEQQEVLSLLRQHMANTVLGSAYNWVRPSLWTSVFGKSLAAHA